MHTAYLIYYTRPTKNYFHAILHYSCLQIDFCGYFSKVKLKNIDISLCRYVKCVYFFLIRLKIIWVSFFYIYFSSIFCVDISLSDSYPASGIFLNTYQEDLSYKAFFKEFCFRFNEFFLCKMPRKLVSLDTFLKILAYVFLSVGSGYTGLTSPPPPFAFLGENFG